MKSVDHTSSTYHNSSGIYKGSMSNHISTVSSCNRKAENVNTLDDFKNMDGFNKNSKDNYLNVNEYVSQSPKPIQCQYDTARSCLPREKLSHKKSSVVYRCRKCRSVLASDDNILAHHKTGKNSDGTGNFISSQVKSIGGPKSPSHPY